MLRRGDRVSVVDVPGVWHIYSIERHTIWLAGVDGFAKTFSNLSPHGIVGVRRQDVTSHQPTGDTLL